MPRDITITFSDGTSAVYKGAPDDVTPEQVQARAQQEFGKPIASLDGGKKPSALPEVGRVAGKIVQEGVMGMPGFIGDVGLAAARNVDNAPWTVFTAGTKLARMIPAVREAIDNTKFGDVGKTLRTLGGNIPDFHPETESGKAIGNVGASILGTVLTGGTGTIAQKATVGLGSGAAGEAAARATDDNPIARLIAAVLGGGAVSIAQALKPNSKSLIQQSTQHMGEADWNKAKVLEATLGNEGIDHLKSQVLGPRSTLDDVVAQAGTNPSVRPKLVTAVANSADQAKAAADRWSMQNLPVVVGERREVLNDIQGAAQMAINQAKQRANAAYTSNMPAVGTRYEPQAVEGLYTQLRDLAKSSKYGETTDAGKAILRLADDLMQPGGKLDTSGANAVMLARAQRAGQDLSTVPGVVMKREPVTDAHQINNLIKELNLKATLDNYKGLPLSDVKALMKSFTGDFDAARAAKTAVMNSEVNPMQKGLAGDIANMGGGIKPTRYTAKDTALDMVFPKDKAQPNEIIALERAVGADGVGTLLREYFTRAAGRTFVKDATEYTTQQPFKFSQAVTGTQEQRANVDAALHIVAKANGVNPSAVRDGFRKLIDAFDSFDNLKLPSQIDRASLGQEAGKNALSFVVAPNSRIGRFWNERVMAKTYNQIADIVTSKDGLKQLEAIAKSPKRDAAQTLATSVILSTMQSESLDQKTP